MRVKSTVPAEASKSTAPAIIKEVFSPVSGFFAGASVVAGLLGFVEPVGSVDSVGCTGSVGSVGSVGSGSVGSLGSVGVDGSVGSVIGMMNGASAIPAQWTEPWGGKLATSIEGYNLVTLEELTKETLALINA